MFRLLVFLHRWMGVALAVLFMVWFASGIVMMYWEFPVRSSGRSPGAEPGYDGVEYSFSASRTSSPEFIRWTPCVSLSRGASRLRGYRGRAEIRRFDDGGSDCIGMVRTILLHGEDCVHGRCRISGRFKEPCATFVRSGSFRGRTVSRCMSQA